ncbi:binding-protein-dependent transport systems inner membrane component [Thermodesulfatator indicus DSM 15286]|uniref:Binding-protein-dependent transport systems inner membrane component n=1 Tax=Thermodesulfatator indicus (strain DSM 15286 / JCM 11887 / CIR29812) TaxID=667014 RepID=F8A9Z7_THEID|nr:ABC transporter permease [Thermodesulfatator indicus]AEH44202.1 binding-protein-dependent transport systems inner membrane component [Thermodesulfatator indicus DSM 15286]
MGYITEGILKAFELLVTFDPETYSAIKATLKVSSYSMAASLAIGIPLGFLLGFYEFPGKKPIRTIVDTLLALPTVLIGLLVYALLTQKGPLGEYGLLFTLPGIAIGQTILALPIVIALTATAVESLDRNLRLTLLSLGVNRIQLLFTYLWEARFGILTAAVAAYGRVLTEVGISLMVGGNIKWHTRTITTAIALETSKGQFAMGIALGLVLLTIALLVNLSLSFFRKRC